MFQKIKTVIPARWRVQIAGIASLTAALFVLPAMLAPSLHAQDGPRTFSCESNDGQRTVCRADMSRGPVEMTRQLGEVRCIEGSTWGRQNDGVWVDRGCRAEFVQRRAPRRDMTRIAPGMLIPVRTNERITTDRADGRIFTGSVARDVFGTNGALAIPRGSPVELIVRPRPDGDLVLDLQSVVANGQRYAVSAGPDHVEANAGDRNDGQRTGKFVGGGALLGAIVGAVAGGGKGAAIGAGAGAMAGGAAEIATSGREVRIPPESIVTFRIEHEMMMGVADDDEVRGGVHYRRDYNGR